jgi:alanine racemase
MRMDAAPTRHDGSIESRLTAAGLPLLPRLAWLEVDLGVLADNARRLRDALSAGTSLSVVVKADGYGHGLVAAARAALAGGATALVVATLDEGLVLRDSGIGSRILVQYPVPTTMLPVAIDAGLDIVAADEDSVRALCEWFASAPPPPAGPVRDAAPAPAPRVHLGIDTGLSRGGLRPGDGVVAARRLLGAGLPALAGTWSHLASPEDPAAVGNQVRRFEALLAALRAAGIDPGLRHLDATGGLLAGVSPAYDLVRVGLAFYGVVPPDVPIASRLERAVSGLRPALSLRTRAATVTTIEAGTAVGYGGTWTATRPSVIATLPVGYADGWARAYATDGWGLTRGRRVPIVGRISSDATAVDVTDVDGFGAGDEVVLLGTEGAMTVHDLAERRGSISWEVMDALAMRLPRVYTDGGVPVGFRYPDGRARLAT